MGEKSLAAPGNRNCLSGRAGTTLHQLSYIPIDFKTTKHFREQLLGKQFHKRIILAQKQTGDWEMGQQQAKKKKKKKKAATEEDRIKPICRAYMEGRVTTTVTLCWRVWFVESDSSDALGKRCVSIGSSVVAHAQCDHNPFTTSSPSFERQKQLRAHAASDKAPGSTKIVLHSAVPVFLPAREVVQVFIIRQQLL